MNATMMKEVTKEYAFQIFVEKCEGVYVAHALEAGMLATANDKDEALFKIGKMLARHIEFAEENDRPEEIYRPSSPEVWSRFARAQESGKARKVESRSRFFSDRMDGLLNQTTYATANC